MPPTPDPLDARVIKVTREHTRNVGDTQIVEVTRKKRRQQSISLNKTRLIDHHLMSKSFKKCIQRVNRDLPECLGAPSFQGSVTEIN